MMFYYKKSVARGKRTLQIIACAAEAYALTSLHGLLRCSSHFLMRESLQSPYLLPCGLRQSRAVAKE